jgi:hypothetical protein
VKTSRLGADLSEWKEARPRVCEAWWMEAAVWSKATGVTNDSSVALACDAALSRGCQVQPTSRRPGLRVPGNELTQPHHQRQQAPSIGFLEQYACRLTLRIQTSPRTPHSAQIMAGIKTIIGLSFVGSTRAHSHTHHQDTGEGLTGVHRSLR